MSLKMDSLLNIWMQLFDENNFVNVKNEPDALKPVTMLFLTIQQEFKKIENSMSEQINTLRSTIQNNVSLESISSNCTISNQSNLNSSTPTPTNLISKFDKSPTFNKHRRKPRKRKRAQKPIQSLNITPDNEKKSDVDILDSSIIDGTPTVKILKPKEIISDVRSTLSKMFHDISSQYDKKRKAEKNDDHSKKQTENFGGDIHSFFESSGSSCFVKDYDKIPEVKKKSDETKKVLRGKERRELKGWSCKDCEKFYEGMNLKVDELERKMNECSKHRNKFKPDETFPGFWDMSIPQIRKESQVEENSQSNSPENSFDKSTIYF